MEVEDTDTDTLARIQKFQVTNPVYVNNHTKYTVTGVDRDGDFNCTRRYNQFHCLLTTLQARWPGFYIPALPEKQAMNTTDSLFLEERRQLLERFLKEIAKYEYIVTSSEFSIFARSGDNSVNVSLNALPKQPPIEILNKYRKAFKINELQSDGKISQYQETVKMF